MGLDRLGQCPKNLYNTETYLKNTAAWGNAAHNTQNQSVFCSAGAPDPARKMIMKSVPGFRRTLQAAAASQVNLKAIVEQSIFNVRFAADSPL
jgi:hypothetical protein